MGTKVGLWIDHRKAIVVTVTDKGEEMGLIVSTVQKQLRRSGDSPLKGPYEQQQVESILIFGPGEAKGELKKRLKRKTLGRRIAGVETVDKMTDRQIAAKVRQRFTESRSAIGSRRNHLTRPSSGRG